MCSAIGLREVSAEKPDQREPVLSSESEGSEDDNDGPSSSNVVTSSSSDEEGSDVHKLLHDRRSRGAPGPSVAPSSPAVRLKRPAGRKAGIGGRDGNGEEHRSSSLPALAGVSPAELGNTSNQLGRRDVASLEPSTSNRRDAADVAADAHEHKSTFKGVYWNNRDMRWFAQIRFKKAQVSLGTFTDEAAAGAAFDKAALLVIGREAELNFPLSNYLDADGAIIEDQGIKERLQKRG